MGGMGVGQLPQLGPRGCSLPSVVCTGEEEPAPCPEMTPYQEG